MNLVVFDVDGTIVDSQHLIVAAQREAFAAHGLTAPSRERSLSVVGLSLAEAFTALVGAHGPVEGLVQAYKDAFARLRADPARQEPFFPGAPELIGELAAGANIVLGIATGNPAAGSRISSRATAGIGSSRPSRRRTTPRPSRTRPCCARPWPRWACHLRTPS